MNIAIASSRGEGLEDVIKELDPSSNLEVIYSSGAKLMRIMHTALPIIKKNPHHNIHIYIVGGYCDLTERLGYQMNINGREKRYEEFVFREAPESAVPRVIGLLHRVNEALSQTNSTPIFCTIPPSHLHKWNTTRLSQPGKTCMLNYTEEDYIHMQRQLIHSIVEINKHIIGINKDNGVHTPKLADTILKKKGKGRGYRMNADGLVDGVHPTTGINQTTGEPEPNNNTRRRWAELILEAVSINRAPRLAKRPEQAATSPASDSESDSEHPQKRNKFTVERPLK